MAILLAAALFVAQAINFGLLLGERRQGRLDQITGPIAARIVDVINAPPNERQREPDIQQERLDRGRTAILRDNPITAGMQRRMEIEDALKHNLAEVGIRPAQVLTGIRKIPANDPRFAHMNRFRAERLRNAGSELLIAVEQPGRGWVSTSVPWQTMDGFIVWRLIAQTLILYGVILLPVLWIGRRISQPLRTLARAARSFRPGDDSQAVREEGPQDVRAVTSAFNALRTNVTGMLDEKDRMLGAIGHDLRTPLAALRVRIESVDDEDDRAKMADTIDEMNRTLDDILSLARLGRPSEAATEVDLAALVDAVVEDFRDLGSPVEFVEADRLPIRIRPSLMRRAVRNLIENAVKYGGEADVSLAATATEAAITVADRGPGIPEARIGEVFEPFTRLEGSRNKETGGIGLGLALARAIVREARGEIVLANRPDGGLAATITLPR
ncbi:MAG: HAMP domain-containing protein [Sphingomonas sp.]|nr:HAMP domain-containing protein [Sphingomonas sp.]